MRKKVRILFFILLTVEIIFTIGFFSNLSDSSSNDTSSADGFEIEKYKVVLDVNENNKVQVNEYITVNWYEEGHHGIYKFTPEWLKYTSKDGKTIKRKSLINNLKAINDKYEVDYVNEKARIKIGDASETVSTGLKEYQISYEYDMGTDPFKNYDEFIFHAYGDYWGTNIKNASLEVHMPKDFDATKINFFTDKYRKNNVNDYVDYEVKDNVIFATFNDLKYYSEKNKKLNTSLTIDIELSDNYFVNSSTNYGKISFTLIIITILLTLINLFTWFKHGKNLPKKEKTIEFYAPDNLSSCEIGYIYNNGNFNKKLVISTIVQLASKGYILIDELNDKEKNIQITNLYPKPIENLYEVPKRVINVTKLKEIDSALSSNAKTVMHYLFKVSNTKELTANFKSFDEVKEELISGNYIKVLNDNENEIKTIVENKEKIVEQNKKMYEIKMNDYNITIKKLKPLSVYEEEIYNKLFEKENVVIMKEQRKLYLAYAKIEELLTKDFDKKINDDKTFGKTAKSILISFSMINIDLFSYFVFEDLKPSLSVLYLVPILCFVINIIITMLMGKRTQYGEEIRAKVLGFKDFLNDVEKEKIEELVLDNPTYFYDILPYTYVLNISKKWIDKFESIQMEKIDMGNINLYDYSSLNNICGNFYTSTSSSSSSCGGGCSSCGGGCSSCGGGGSW